MLIINLLISWLVGYGLGLRGYRGWAIVIEILVFILLEAIASQKEM